MLNKEHCQPFIRKKNTRSVKPNQKPKMFEKPNIVGLKSVCTKYQKLGINYPRVEDKSIRFPSRS